MSDYTIEEKRRVLLFVLQNPLKVDEPDWEVIGAELDRDPEQVRSAYVLWKMESEKTEQLQSQEVAEGQVEVHQPKILTIDAGSNFANEDQYFTLYGYEGEIVTSEDLEHMFDSEVVADLDVVEQGVTTLLKKRNHGEVDESDSSYLRSLEQHSQFVLEMRREKHKKVMELLDNKIEQGRELHKEKMEILREKRRCLQRQLHDLDTVICEKKRVKRYKSSHF